MKRLSSNFEKPKAAHTTPTRGGTMSLGCFDQRARQESTNRVSSTPHTPLVVHRFSFCADGYAFSSVPAVQEIRIFRVTVLRVFSQFVRALFTFSFTQLRLPGSTKCCRRSGSHCSRYLQCCHQLSSASGSYRSKSSERIK